MSLPTPPATTSRRDKENHAPLTPQPSPKPTHTFPGSRVVWSQHDEIHSIGSGNSPLKQTQSLPALSSAASAASTAPRPIKSILKKTAHVVLPDPDEEERVKKRETTPMPNDPYSDANYLRSCVDKIVGESSALKDIIEGYSVMMGRLRNLVDPALDANYEWPLFAPIRDNRDALAEAIVRDLGRALVEPARENAADDEKEEDCVDERATLFLPSPPRSSPNKDVVKKRGMSAEAVKYARDLCTTCHTTLRFLGAMWTMPIVYQIFTERHLSEMLTSVLAIPLCLELPTPNARKTCGLATWLIQNQRLPEEVLLPARDRIAYALRRGVEGELGKEGKKGSINDGLKAIQDLTIYLPSIFVPAFVPLLPSILSNLLAPTLPLRAQACQALTALAQAQVIHGTSLSSSLRSKQANDIREFLISTDELDAFGKESLIVRTLRTTLGQAEPKHSAQGPVWGLCVLANFIALLGEKLTRDVRMMRTTQALLTLALRHKRSTIRAMACLVLRCTVWAYFKDCFEDEEEDREPGSSRHQARSVSDEETDESSEDEVEDEKTKAERTRKVRACRDGFWKTIGAVVDMGTGTSTIAALLAVETDGDANLRQVLDILTRLVQKGGENARQAIEVVRALVADAVNADAQSDATALLENRPWDYRRMLPAPLFDLDNGLLVTEWKHLSEIVRPMFGHCLQPQDVRPLTSEELSKEWVVDTLVEVWKAGLRLLEIQGGEHEKTPTDVWSVWHGIVKANVDHLQCPDGDVDTEAAVKFTEHLFQILLDVLLDPTIDLTVQAGPPLDALCSNDDVPAVVPSTSSSSALKLHVVHDFWRTIYRCIPYDVLHVTAPLFVASLRENWEDLIGRNKDAWVRWASLCADLLIVCDIEEVKAFWSTSESWMGCELEQRISVWRRFMETCTSSSCSLWQAAVFLLGVPFAEGLAWDMSSEDLNIWEASVVHATNESLDFDGDAFTVLDEVAKAVSRAQWHAPATSASPMRAADILLSQLEISEARGIPAHLFEFVNDTLVHSYPPEPRNQVTCMWLIRTLGRIVNLCPPSLVLDLLESVQEGVSVWISDEYRVMSEAEYSFEILPLYESVLVCIQALRRSYKILAIVSVILASAFSGREDKPHAVAESFLEFWDATYEKMAGPDCGWPKPVLESVDAARQRIKNKDSKVSEESSRDADLREDSKVDSETASVSCAVIPDKTADEILEFPNSDDEEISERSSAFTADAERLGLEPKPLSTPAGGHTIRPETPPPRPLKRKSFPGDYQNFSPSSPFTPSQSTTVNGPKTPEQTPTAVPTSLFYSNSSGGRRLNKENVSPVRRTPSEPTTKRQRQNSRSEEPESPSKSGRRVKKVVTVPVFQIKKQANSSEQTDSDSEKEVEDLLTRCGTTGEFTFTSSLSLSASKREQSRKSARKPLLKGVRDPSSPSDSNSSSSSATPSPSSLKRKRMFLDAVELNSSRPRGTKRWTSLDPGSDMFRRKRVHKGNRTISLQNALEAAVYLDEGKMDETKPRKRIRRSESEPPLDQDDEDSEDLLKDIDGLDIIAGSDDSILHAPLHPVPKSELVSEPPTPMIPGEDVAAHHVISPILRRTKSVLFSEYEPEDEDEEDSLPGSDDSVASPTKDRVLRRESSLMKTATAAPSIIA